MLKHRRATDPRLGELFTECRTMDELMKRIPMLSKSLIETNPKQYVVKADPEENFRTVEGWLFEIFAEIVAKAYAMHPDIGLHHYVPVDEHNDRGVDAYCYNVSNNRTAVQVKFSADSKRLYTGSGFHGRNYSYETGGLDTFVSRAALEEQITGNISLLEAPTLVFITSGAGIDPRTRQDKFLSKVKSIGYPQLTKIVDNNHAFWVFAEHLIAKSAVEFKYSLQKELQCQTI